MLLASDGLTDGAKNDVITEVYEYFHIGQYDANLPITHTLKNIASFTSRDNMVIIYIRLKQLMTLRQQFPTETSDKHIGHFQH